MLTMTTNEFEEALEQVRRRISIAGPSVRDGRDARASLEALRVGVPPPRGALELSVDREDEFLQFTDDIEKVASGNSKLVIISGSYGAGKSHLLYVLRELALARNLAVSLVSLTHNECPIFDLLAIYRRIIQGLEVEGDDRVGALESSLDRWAASVQAYARGSRELARTVVRGLPREFQTVLTAYLHASRTNDEALRSLALSWLRGEVSTKADARVLGVPVPTSENALWMLTNIAKLLRFLKLDGLVTLLDEAESLSSIVNLPDREAAFQNLRELTRAAHASHCFFVYATTPDFMQYAESVFSSSSFVPRTMQVGPLARPHLVELSQVIRDLHLECYSWGNVSRVRGSNWTRSIHRLQNQGVIDNRSFVRSVVSLLDICQQDPTIMPTDVVQVDPASS